jgi:hypothetical protein
MKIKNISGLEYFLDNICAILYFLQKIMKYWGRFYLMEAMLEITGRSICQGEFGGQYT